MNLRTYKVFDIQPKWVKEPEALGSKQKFWFSNPTDGKDWLFNTLSYIFLSIDKIFDNPNPSKELFAKYLLLDAIIGNTDRHHENWGVLWKESGIKQIGYLAPSFDHASSLGRELPDEGNRKSRQKYLAEKRVGDYSEKAHGAIYWENSDNHGLSPLALIRKAFKQYESQFRPSLSLVDKLDISSLELILNSIPADWMTSLSRKFVLELVFYNVEEIKKIK